MCFEKQVARDFNVLLRVAEAVKESDNCSSTATATKYWLRAHPWLESGPGRAGAQCFPSSGGIPAFRAVSELPARAGS